MSGRPRSSSTRSGGYLAATASASARGGGRMHLVLSHPQVDPQRPQDLRLVVHDQDPGHSASRSHRGALEAAPSLAALPRPSVGSTQSRRHRAPVLAHSVSPPALDGTFTRSTGHRPRRAGTRSWSARRPGCPRRSGCRPSPRSAPGQRQAKPDARGVVSVAEPLERHEHPLPVLLRVCQDPGRPPAVSTRSPQRARRPAAAGCPAGEYRSAFCARFTITRSRIAGSALHGRQRVGDVDPDVAAAEPTASSARATTSSRPDRAGEQRQRARPAAGSCPAGSPPGG